MKTGVVYGIVASSKTRVRCIFCGVHIPKANRCIEQHMNGAKHKDNRAIMNENGISFKDQALYCKPCKLVVPSEDSVTDHIETEDHCNWKAAIDDLIDGEFFEMEAYLSSENDNVFCEACNTVVVCSLPIIEGHVNDIDHRKKVVEKLKPLNAIFTVDGNTTQVWCKICNRYFANDVDSILLHVDDDDVHYDLLNEMEDLIENQEITIRGYLCNRFEEDAFCVKCNIDVRCTVLALRTHITGELHMNNMGL